MRFSGAADGEAADSASAVQEELLEGFFFFPFHSEEGIGHFVHFNDSSLSK